MTIYNTTEGTIASKNKLLAPESRNQSFFIKNKDETKSTHLAGLMHSF